MATQLFKTLEKKEVDYNMIKKLIEDGADATFVNPNDGYNSIQTFLGWSRVRSPENNIAILKLLIDYGANVNHKTHQGDTPLHIGCYEDIPYDVMKFLIEQGADKNIKNNEDLSAVYCASPKLKELLSS